jgi:hypothetical protein
MKLFIWTNVLTDSKSKTAVIAVGETLTKILDTWEKRANESNKGYSEVRGLVTIDQDAVKKGDHRYKVNRRYWIDHPTLKQYNLDEADSKTYWIKNLDMKQLLLTS